MSKLAIVVSFLALTACGSAVLDESMNEGDNEVLAGAALGETCNQFTEPCQAGLSCSSINADGECIDEAAEKAACEVEDGVWGAWGSMGNKSCNHRLADGGAPCTDGSECEGFCILTDEENNMGECQELETQFGCFSFLIDGEPLPTFCID